jgi:hypothetical protein
MKEKINKKAAWLRDKTVYYTFRTKDASFPELLLKVIFIQYLLLKFFYGDKISLWNSTVALLARE